MIVTNDLNFDIKETSLALGFFDGIHLGHQRVLNDAINFSKKLGTKSVVLTFRNHPTEILYGQKCEFITTPEERTDIFEKMGFDVVIMADFTDEIARMTHEEYFKKVIQNLNPKSISIGYNHKFGAKKLGNAEFLMTNCKKTGCELSIAEQIKTENDITVSSTFIKNLIKSGETEEASRLMIKPFSMKNTVIKGMQRGREMGFPTANLEFPDKKLIPKNGVYAGYTAINGIKLPSVANVGLRPTFNDISAPLTEIHILKFNKNLYGEDIEFEFVKKLRDEVRFSAADALIGQINSDIQTAIAFFKKQYV